MNAMDSRTRSLVIWAVALIIGIVIGVSATQWKLMVRHDRRMADARKSSTVAEPYVTSAGQWDPLQGIQRAQARMDRDFNDMFERFRMQPQLSGLQANPNYALSMNVEDMKDHYEVRAFLPDAKASDVHTTLENGSLKVDVNSKESKTTEEKNGSTQMSEWGQYEEVVQLPGPVKANQMTVKHEGNELIIDVPKA